MDFPLFFSVDENGPEQTLTCTGKETIVTRGARVGLLVHRRRLGWGQHETPVDVRPDGGNGYILHVYSLW